MSLASVSFYVFLQQITVASGAFSINSIVLSTLVVTFAGNMPPTVPFLRRNILDIINLRAAHFKKTLTVEALIEI